MQAKLCSVLVASLLVGCAYSPTVSKRRMAIEDLDRYEINCNIAIQQINFLNSQKTTRREVLASRAEVSKYNLVAKFNGIMDPYTPNTSDYRQHRAQANDEFNHTINYKIEQINQYCLGNYENPNVCYAARPDSPACVEFRRK
ncbi:hypothetical protein UFOVP116_144 [uncultured Caudovirales phage]|uniref:Lipoprotein n=1 Tax=uncultured Caudovirales phage TaxID=2100421 RepID=A0A6J5LDY3_9CAUD|nr:hypothetical protein UFOVP116_144 [uncultured Caudovirales phage]